MTWEMHSTKNSVKQEKSNGGSDTRTVGSPANTIMLTAVERKKLCRKARGRMADRHEEVGGITVVECMRVAQDRDVWSRW